jgi:serine phosphatase RsbU (regulator of sigma subunit)/CHASE2 domain-containing sensor protein
VAVLCATSLLAEDPGPLPALRLWTFDRYQVYFPRPRKVEAAVIVAIDDDSLRRVGQWPWPRDLLAGMLDRIAAQKPGAIGFDVLFIELDRTSPERIAEAIRPRDRNLADQLARLGSNDAILAEAIARTRAVLGVAGVDAPMARGTPRARALLKGPKPPLHEYPGGLRSLPVLDHAAAGHALLNAEAERGIVRGMPVAASVAGDPMLTMALETFRVGNRLASFNVNWSGKSITSVEVGDIEVPTHSDGNVWLHFTPPDLNRYVSAADVLEGKPESLARLNGVIVLIGATALALLDQNTSARGERMPGIEFHAQLIENIVEDKLLSRPAWTRFLEAGLFALTAAAFIVLVPRTRPGRSFALLLAFAAVVVTAGIVAFLFGRTLFDPATPLAGTALLFGLMLSASLVAADLERRGLSARLAHEREAAARVMGEQEAARRIQMGMLPTRESVMRHEQRIDIFAHMKAAREVGGDLYDFLLLPGNKFVVIVGDISGKGLPAAMFMAVSKALAKSIALRAPAGAAQLMTIFNREISRENSEQMFVTLVALIIDLETGYLDYCNAGHEPPILVRRDGETITLDDGGGPPLCVMDDFPYEEAHLRLEPRDVLALASDGLTEAMNRSGTLYGRARLKALLDSPAKRGLDVAILGNDVLAAIKTFEGGAEPSDDQTLLLVSWLGN